MKEVPYTHILKFRHGLAKRLLCMVNDPAISKTVSMYGEFSEAEVEVFRHFVKPEDTVLDIGALFGCHTLALAELAAVVVAFEPQRIPFQILCANLALNSVRNVHAYNVALSNHPGLSFMPAPDPSEAVNWGLHQTCEESTRKRADRSELVKLRSLDDILFDQRGDPLGLIMSGFAKDAPGRPLTFAKIDVEGDEPVVLLGAYAAIIKYRPVLYVEFQSHQEEILAILHGRFNYVTYLHKAPADPRDTGVPMLLAHPNPAGLMLDPEKCGLGREWLHANGFTPV